MYQNRGFGLGGTLSPAIKNIIYANVILFVVSQFSFSFGQFLINNFALTFDGIFSQFKIWQLVTYMFLHGGFLHILFNMFFLWMFGTELEYEWGTTEFVKYYFITGIGGAVFNLVFATSNIPTLGASAAVYGVMLAFALKDPDRPVYL